MDNVIIYSKGKTTTISVRNALQRWENEGGVTVEPLPEELSVKTNITKRIKKLFRSAA